MVGAFAVAWKDIERWSVIAQRESGWTHAIFPLVPIGETLERRVEFFDRRENQLRPAHFISLRFDGSVEPRALHGKTNFRGTLFLAETGDLVFSKIDLRNGAIGLVPASIPQAAVTSEFPVYRVKPEALPEYLVLLTRSATFREAVNALVSGTSGRKRVTPEAFEALCIPLPPLAIQRAIVAEWQKSQAEIAASRARADSIEAKARATFLAGLGLREPATGAPRKCFAVQWSDLPSWQTRAVWLTGRARALGQGHFPWVTGRDCLLEVRHGCSASPADRPTGFWVAKISAATKGEFRPDERKPMSDHPRLRQDFDLRRGDVLLCRTNGTLDYVGMSALVEDDQADLIFPDKLMRVRVGPQLLPGYYWLIMQSTALRIQIEAAARTAVGNYAIGGDDILNFRLPLPPLVIQQTLVAAMSVARSEAARERSAANARAAAASAALEAMLLGSKSPQPL